MPILPAPDDIRRLVERHGSPLLLLSPRTAVRQYRSLVRALPGALVRYALKALPNRDLVAALARAGSGFDLCAAGEVDICAGLGIAPERCIHTHPIKNRREIEHALTYGCRCFVVDNPAELDKFVGLESSVELFLRLSFRSQTAVVDLSYKFGVAPDEAHDLLRLADRRGLRVRGLCFHVGSQNLEPGKYLEAIGFCRKLFNLASLDGIALDTLDIGGGFPVPYTRRVPPIATYCRPIAQALSRSFPDTRIIVEPGRFIAAPSVTLVAAVVGKAIRQGIVWYYLNDGVYGSLSGRIYDHADYSLHTVKGLEDPDLPCRPSVVAGPTCDSIDVIWEQALLPELEIGDLVCCPHLGAYSSASASDFNFVPRTPFVLID